MRLKTTKLVQIYMVELKVIPMNKINGTEKLHCVGNITFSNIIEQK